MANTQVSVLYGNALKLAADQYGDATGFVAIMQANWLTDYIINGPVKAVTAATNSAGDSTLVMVPTAGIQIGDLVYCSGLDTYALVLNVTQVYSVPGGLPFCQCSAAIGVQSTTPAPLATLTTSASAVVGASKLVFARTGGIRVGQSVYALNILDGTAVLGVSSTTITLTNAILGPIGSGSVISFGSPAEPVAIIPPSGGQVSTNVVITPVLDNPMELGSEVTFVAGTPITINLPTTAPSRGVPT